MTTVRYLSSDDVRGLATPVEFVDAVRDAYRQRGGGAPAKPRTVLTRSDPGGMLTAYTALLPEQGTMGGYMYSAGFGSSDSWFVTPLFDAERGELLALIDGAWMNPFKTGATGAVAVDALARPDASRVALFGSGPQAAGQLQTTATVRDLDHVKVFSPTPEHRRSFADEFDETLAAKVEAVDSPPVALERADIVITATTSQTPVFDGEDLEPGAHVTAMGQYHPKRREVDARTVARSTYVPDLRERIEQDAGAYLLAVAEGAIAEDHVHAELGEVIAGFAPGRPSEAAITLFDSGGTGIETVAAAQLLYERAKEADLGMDLQWYSGEERLTGRR